MEAGRPTADETVLELLGRRELRRGDVYETREGVCRIGPDLARELAQQGPALARSADSPRRPASKDAARTASQGFGPARKAADPE